jgi:hypothetical protein
LRVNRPLDLSVWQRELPPEFDATIAKYWLAQKYKAPLKLLASLEESGQIIRLKRGLYVFANKVDKLAIAGSLHGSSYISFETALAFYNLIPDRVETVLSVTDSHPIKITTPVARYEYYSQSRRLFSLGMSMTQSRDRAFLIASMEKAVLDSVARAHLQTKSLSKMDVWEFAIGSLRIEPDMLLELSIPKMRDMAMLYRNLAPRKLVDAIESQFLRQSKKGAKRE